MFGYTKKIWNKTLYYCVVDFDNEFCESSAIDSGIKRSRFAVSSILPLTTSLWQSAAVRISRWAAERAAGPGVLLSAIREIQQMRSESPVALPFLSWLRPTISISFVHPFNSVSEEERLRFCTIWMHEQENCSSLFCTKRDKLFDTFHIVLDNLQAN